MNGITVQQNTGTLRNGAGEVLALYAKQYDDFNRLAGKQLVVGDRAIYREYAYQTDADGKTGNLVDQYQVYYWEGTTKKTLTYYYTYDANGNIVRQRSITREQRNSTPVTPLAEDLDGEIVFPELPVIVQENILYTYDEAGQLVEVNDEAKGLLYQYAYDASGNIMFANVHGSIMNTTLSSKSFVYSNGLLTGYTDGDTSVQYTLDSMGSPVRIATGDETRTLTWGEGRALTGIFIDDENYTTYTYNADGLRTSKTVVVNGVEERTYYVWGNNGLAGVITHDHTVVVLYDDDGESIGFSLDGTVFTYVKNLQGDVVRVLDSNGSEVLTYSYDPWGVPTVASNPVRIHTSDRMDYRIDLTEYNPCTYRGYYYDQETGYYYLQSRYYDPEIGRFLNADEAACACTDNLVVSSNLFIYCKNNPICHADPNGYIASNVIGAIVGAVIGL